MEIRINKLRLHNFKGAREAEFIFSGHNARIEGPNGSGKSTVFDAFTWLLFGKDHRGQTADTFELKTIDPATGKPYPREDHWVEAELLVEGMPHTLRRTWAENWVKPTGEVEEVLKGHTAAFFVDGVNVGTKRAYDQVIAAWINEDSFKLLTNPFYFIDDTYTHWKDRRAALIELVKDSPERSRVREEFADIVGDISGRDIDAYRKQLAAEKAANKRDLSAIMSRIDGIREALPKEVDEGGIRRSIAAEEEHLQKVLAPLVEKKEALDKSIASADTQDEARKAENDAIWRKITEVQMWMKSNVETARKAAQENNGKVAEDLRRAEFALNGAKELLHFHETKDKDLKDSIAIAEQERGKAAADLAELGEKYKVEKARFFDYKPSTTCPTCGQELPAASIEEAITKAREAFTKERKDTMDTIIASAQTIKAAVVNMDENIKSIKQRIEENTPSMQEKAKDVMKWTAEVQRLKAIPAQSLDAAEEKVRATPEFKAKFKEELDLRAKAMQTASRPDDLVELVFQRSEVEKEIAAAKANSAEIIKGHNHALSICGVRREQLDLIAQKEREAKRFADAVAACERQEARVAEYVRRDIESVNAAIAANFRIARWKMFDQTLDGGYVEMCEVTSPDGVPYRSMNDAMKILCGIDCIRVFGERYGMKAPIFIDNAECILKDRFDTDAQVVRLVVTDRQEIKLTAE